MALVNIASASTVVVIAPKTIVVKAAASAILYTVPTGRTFAGNAVNNGNMELVINGIYAVQTSTVNPLLVPITLTAGTVVSSGASYFTWSLVGLES